MLGVEEKLGHALPGRPARERCGAVEKRVGKGRMLAAARKSWSGHRPFRPVN